jgi:hypothetical protein
MDFFYYLCITNEEGLGAWGQQRQRESILRHGHI